LIRKFRETIAGLLFVLILQCSAIAQEDVPEKRVVFYTTYGFLDADDWIIPLKLWVYEEPDFARRLAARAARSELQERSEIPELTPEQEERFIFRSHGFVADSESREAVLFQFDNDLDKTRYQLVDSEHRSVTDRNGLLEGSINISALKADALLSLQESENGWLTFRAVSENHGGVGRVRLIPPTGISVISDVDDTVKVTEIPKGEKVVLKNTFFEEFLATPCMANMYSAMDRDTAFHYVSGGPWQMYQPLREFLFSSKAGFPEGSFHMKSVRTNPFESESYRDIWQLIASGSQQVTFEQKIEQISTLLQRFPSRQFILVGDSGEKDPEVFAEIRDRFAGQVAEIRIRDVVNAAVDDPERLDGTTVILPDADRSGRCMLQ
jgi:hypothetical protein